MVKRLRSRNHVEGTDVILIASSATWFYPVPQAITLLAQPTRHVSVHRANEPACGESRRSIGIIPWPWTETMAPPRSACAFRNNDKKPDTREVSGPSAKQETANRPAWRRLARQWTHELHFSSVFNLSATTTLLLTTAWRRHLVTTRSRGSASAALLNASYLFRESSKRDLCGRQRPLLSL